MASSLFDDDARPTLAVRLASVLHSWAERGIYFGTSSWKYPGWLGSIYTADRYMTRNRFSKARFESECIREYAETFPAVGGDFSFYQFPTPESWEKVFAGTPRGFQFGLKVPEAVTVKKWPGHARYGMKAGENNEHFLDAGLFSEAFLRPLEPYRDRVGVFIFEFGTFSHADFDGVDSFLHKLDGFLAALPGGWRYAVEIRNKEYLGPGYFSTLAARNVAHVFNAWTRMPTLVDQIELPGAFTADFAVVRALLQKGRSYEQAVRMLEPYEKIQTPDPSTREAVRKIADACVQERRRAYLFVNNRLEGSAPQTIEAIAAGE